MNTTSKTAFAYIRVSTSGQEELSPDAQIRLIKDYAAKNNIIINRIFQENGISGRSAEKRPQFMEMIATCKQEAKDIDTILVWKFSRFARNQEESIVYKSLLKKQHDIDVISVSEPLIEGPFGSLIERIIEWMDEYYSIRLSGEVFRGMKENALRGSYQARPPLGYKIKEKGKPPIVVKDEALIIQLIFNLYVTERKSFFEIARHLNACGYKTSHNKNFETRSIQYIIENPTYIGMIRWNRTENATNKIKDKDDWVITQGEHEAIIDKELFEKAQEINKTTYKPRGARPSSTYKHWLSGVLKCPSCGRTMTASTYKRSNGEQYSHFVCYGYHKGKCSTRNGISSLKLEAELKDMIKDIFSADHIDYEYIIPVDSNQNTRIEVLEAQLKSLAVKSKRVKQLYIDGIDTIEEYKASKKELDAMETTINDELEKLKDTTVTNMSDMELMRKKISNVHDILLSDKHDTATKSNALREITNKIVYNKENDTLKIYLYLSSPIL